MPVATEIAVTEIVREDDNKIRPLGGEIRQRQRNGHRENKPTQVCHRLGELVERIGWEVTTMFRGANARLRSQR